MQCFGPKLNASGSVAEWSKALVLGTSLFGGVGSNPTAAKFSFSITKSLIVCSSIETPRYAVKFIGASAKFSYKTCFLRIPTFCSINISYYTFCCVVSLSIFTSCTVFWRACRASHNTNNE